jgi:hypothetical protein
VKAILHLAPPVEIPTVFVSWWANTITRQ